LTVSRRASRSIAVRSPIEPADVVTLSRELRVAARRGRGPVVIAVDRLVPADMRTVDALARLALEARRLGRAVRLAGASPDLRALIEFTGLGEVLPVSGRR
jgi:ABC-type transporter Mla MlaB component